MLNSSHRSIALGVALLGLSFTAPSFGWSISGTVKSTTGQPLAGVEIGASNVSIAPAYTADDGSFSIVDGVAAVGDVTSLGGIRNVSVSATVMDNVLYLENVNARSLKVSMMDALGKVVFQQSFQQVHGNFSLKLKAKSHGPSFLRLNMDGVSQSYQLRGNGTLLKTGEGEALPFLYFIKSGYAQQGYQMSQEEETGVIITMVPATNTQGSSSSSGSQVTNSSAGGQSSTYVVPEVPANCSGKTFNGSSITVDGRKVNIKYPDGYPGNKPVPMLFNFHPIGSNADTWAQQSQIAPVALADGAIAVFPDGTMHPGMFGSGPQQGSNAWNVGPCCTTADDVTFIRHVVDELIEKTCVDPTRIYASGYSMGSGFSNYAGCFLADKFAAAAPSAMDLSQEAVAAGCNPVRPFPILNFRGTGDNFVDYRGAKSEVVTGMPITFLGAEANFNEWAKMDKCTGSITQNKPLNGCKMYENCAGGAKVGLCLLNGGHVEMEPNTAWNFLKQFKLE